jgi:hypothetical protein
MRSECTRWGMFIAIAAGLVCGTASDAAYAQCTPQGMARFNAVIRAGR